MTTKLPIIHNRAGTSIDDISRTQPDKTRAHTGRTESFSPFRLPRDDEVFVYRDLERKKRDEGKEMANGLKIWDKRIGMAKRPLRLFRTVEGDEQETVRAKSFIGYNPSEKAKIVEAQRIVTDRKKYKDYKGNELKEGILDLIQQKKEMFMVERTVGIIEKEKEALIFKAAEKDAALKKTDEMLGKDWKEFEDYKVKTKHETDFILQRWDQEAEARKKTEMFYKTKNNELITLKAEKTKNEELIQKYLGSKLFLEKLTPKDFLEERARELKEKITEFKTLWLEREVLKKEEQVSLRASLEKETKSPVLPSKKILEKRNSKDDLEKNFHEKLEKGEFEAIEDFSLNQPMYFTDPKQLIGFLLRLEERNVALIRMMHETEQIVDNLKNSLKKKRNEFEKKVANMRDYKALLEKRKRQKEETIKTFEKMIKEPKLAQDFNDLVPLRNKIFAIFARFKEEGQAAVDKENQSTLDLLAQIELYLEKQFLKLKEQKPARVMELKKHFEDIRKRANRKLQQERVQKLAEEKSRKASERAMETTKIRSGRHAMTKSVPPRRRVVVVKVQRNTEEEENMKYFRPYLTNF